MGQLLATANTPPISVNLTKGILKQPAPGPPVMIAVNAQQNQKKVVTFNPSTKFQGVSAFYHSQLGIQCYISLEPNQNGGASIVPHDFNWNNYKLKMTLDQSSLVHCFANITDHVWLTDLIRLHRLSLASAVNPSGMPLHFALTGLLCSNVHHGEQECSDSTNDKITIKVPAYAAHDVQITIYDIINPGGNASKDAHKYWCLSKLQLEAEWNSSSPQQLIQWMLEEKRYLFCVTMMFDFIYSVQQNPDTVFSVIDL